MPLRDSKTTGRAATVLLTFGACIIAIVGSIAQRGAVPPPRPGRQSSGATLLPNGWRIAPAGRHVQIGDLPLNMAPSVDGRFLVITNNGWAHPTLTVFDTKNEQVLARVSVDNAWLGLAWSPDGSHLYSAGAAENAIYDFAWANGSLKEAGRISIGPPERRTGGELLNAGFIGGLAIAPTANVLCGPGVRDGGERDRPRSTEKRSRSHATPPSRTPQWSRPMAGRCSYRSGAGARS